MADASIKLERQPSIPVELINEASHIGSIIEVARTVSTAHTHAALVLADRARTLIRNACPSYQPNEASKAGLMCLSGQEGQPFLGAVCCASGCMVSQVKQEEDKFVYFGKRSIEDDLVKIIFADPEQKDAQTNPDSQPEDRQGSNH